ncbi:hypothetical protein [Tardiphaga sp.]|uniref:hypothetical protein n=1 Tax=Tardiphaga sp. TaxID=1926292 RepID=UPI002635E514|nr:hypothetical protein [Tardiphaga sp.]MDB5620753.1 hypothetical protein [Tardiphaga sp.]
MSAPAPSPAEIKPPRCAMCRGRMVLTRREPQTNGTEKLTFNCPKCEYVKVKQTEDPLHPTSRQARRRR